MKKLCLCILSLLVLLAVLAACRGGEEQPPEPELVSYHAAEYTIVRPEKADDALVEAAVAFQQTLKARTGADVAISDDYVNRGEQPDDAAKEILIGPTNRPQSTAAQQALGGRFGFSLSVSGSKIVVAAPTVELIEEALRYLDETYLSHSEGTGSFPLPEGMNYVSEEYPFIELVSGGEARYTVVYPMSDVEGMFPAAQLVQQALSETAEREATIQTDWINRDQQYDMSTLEVLVGNTQYPYSDELRQGCGYGQWRMEHVENKIYLFGMDPAAVNAVCRSFAERIGKATDLNENGVVKMIDFAAAGGVASEWMNAVPAYAHGTTEKVWEFASGMYQVYVTDTDEAAYSAYLSQLTGAGYALYAENSINGNRFCTYTGHGGMVHACYLPSQQSVRLLMASDENLTMFPTQEALDEAVCPPTLTFMDMNYETQAAQDNGMGLILTLRDGSYIIIDGGYAEDTDGLFAYLQEHNRREDGKILIRAWLISHPHGDHYGNLLSFAERYGSQVTLEYLVAHPSTGNLKDPENVISEWNKVTNTLGRFAGARLIVPLSGQKMTFGNVAFSFFYTPELLYPEPVNDTNDLSFVCRIEFEGQSILLPADAQVKVINLVTGLYGETLQSDFVQAPHHGLSGATKDFYRLVNPSYAFFATAQDKFEERSQTDQAANVYLLNGLNLKEYFVADNGYRTLLFPFQGSDYIDREYTQEDYDALHRDELSWEELLKP